ncbi:amidohydrolase [Lunatibacter salilacus]|uniref:amidohydrolase n=1 Tax=Lunatibacter salilacus TaxID=2483804 RepID=UPI00131E9984|nr:amidohydrolase [Lunatibacter salilacus]
MNNTCIFYLHAFVLVTVLGCTPSKQPAADMILFNGQIITMNKDHSVVEAVAIREGRFFKVGDTDEVMGLATNSTAIIDLEGHTVIPGLIEGHSHFVAASQSEFFEEIPTVENMGQLFGWISEQTSLKKEGDWIIHPKFFFTRLEEIRQPTKEELDSLAPNHPVFLNGSYGGIINTKALEISGLADSDHQGIVRDQETGQTNGVLLRSAFESLAIPQKTELTKKEKKEALKEMLHRYNQAGITSVIAGRSDWEELRLFQELLSDGELTARLYLNMSFPLPPSVSLEEMKNAIEDLGLPIGKGNEWIKMGALKAVIDGGVLTGTAFLREPWGDKGKEIFGRGDPGYRGELYLNKKELVKLITAADDSGWNFTAHVTGGGGVDTLLAAFEEVNALTPIKGKRFSIIHGNFFTDEAILKMKNLGIYANMQPAWLYLDGVFLNQMRGEERMSDFHPYRSLTEAGIKVVGGSDHMVKLDLNSSINPYNPFLSMGTVVTRRTKNNTILNAEERISRQQALEMYTINNAHASFEEEIKGSIEVGKLADLVILSDDILQCPEDKIKDILPVMTILAGKRVYDAGVLMDSVSTEFD